MKKQEIELYVFKETMICLHYATSPKINATHTWANNEKLNGNLPSCQVSLWFSSEVYVCPLFPTFFLPSFPSFFLFLSFPFISPASSPPLPISLWDFPSLKVLQSRAVHILFMQALYKTLLSRRWRMEFTLGQKVSEEGDFITQRSTLQNTDKRACRLLPLCSSPSNADTHLNCCLQDEMT